MKVFYLPCEVSFKKICLTSSSASKITILFVNNIPRKVINEFKSFHLDNNQLNINDINENITIYIANNKICEVITKGNVSLILLFKTSIKHTIYLLTHNNSSLMFHNTKKLSLNIVGNNLSIVEFYGKYSNISIYTHNGASVIALKKKSKSDYLYAKALNTSKINVQHLETKFSKIRKNFYSEIFFN